MTKQTTKFFKKNLKFIKKKGKIMKKNLLSIISILCVLGIYNALVFCLCKNLTNNFWCGYSFITLSIIIVLVSFILTNAIQNKSEVKGLSIKVLSIYYFVFETILGSLLMFFNIDFVVVLLPQLICFLIFIPIYAFCISKLKTQSEETSTKEINKAEK